MKYTNCTLDETTNSFIGKKIGTSDGEYNLVSKYIMIEMSEEYQNDALPCGFMGYQHRKYLPLLFLVDVPLVRKHVQVVQLLQYLRQQPTE